MYTEEKYEDEEDMRERNQTLMGQSKRGHERSLSDSEVVLQDLVQLVKQHGELYPIMLDILKHYSRLLQRDIEL